MVGQRASRPERKDNVTPFSFDIQAATGAVVDPCTRLGRYVIVNAAAGVDHDCAIGDLVHISSGGRVTGSVVRGDAVFIDAGAVMLSARPSARAPR